MRADNLPERRSGDKKGKLTVFAGYFSGVGKSYEMLMSAEKTMRDGVDAVIGLMQLDRWPETKSLAQNFEILPFKAVTTEGRTVCQLDLDACIKRMPELILVDDLSHINIDDSRHVKRYQDIEELLNAGIDVYTTLNVQNVESVRDAVFSTLGTSLKERIPDSVFDKAFHVEFIDIEPERLQQRLMSQNRGDLLSDCTLSQLNALREIGLRRCADRASLRAREAQSMTKYRTHDHILVCLSSAPSNEKIIRTASRMANAFRCEFTALFVETKAFRLMTQADKNRLDDNIRLSRQLGASVETVYGDDVAYQIAEFSRISGVTKIVIGRSGITHRLFFRKPSLTERLVALAPELEIYVIPDSELNGRFSIDNRKIIKRPTSFIFDLLKTVFILAVATLLGFLFYSFGFTEANIITLYILGVMLVSVFTKSYFCSFIASLAGVLTFNFFFTEPKFSLHAYDSGYPVTFLVMFIASLITGSLASKLKSHAKHSAKAAWKTKLLFETDRNLQKAGTQKEIITVTARQLLKIFQRDIVAYAIEDNKPVSPKLFSADSTKTNDSYKSDNELKVAQWVATNNKRAGAGTETFPDSCFTYLSVRMKEQVYAVIGIAASEKPMDSFETDILLSVLGECALALENQKNSEEKEAAAILAKNEQLRADLLRSISHDLRTPLTSISGNASNLISNGHMFDAKTKQQIYIDIYDDSMWLVNLVENLLSVSRLEEGKMKIHVSTELIDDVVAEALRHIDRRSVDHSLNVQNSDDFILAQIDAKLIVQVIINIVDNAIKYTQAGSKIDITWERKGNYVYISIADNGPGVPDQAKPHIFDMFYTVSNQIADSRRSIGLGLALCKSIVNAHGGEISLTDNLPNGSIFTFSVPAGEVVLNE